MKFVTQGAMLNCSYGAAPCPLVVTPGQRLHMDNMSIATENDFTPAHIATFGVCTSTTNPAVASAGGAPVPCVPAITGPWTKASTFVRAPTGQALTDQSTCSCALAATPNSIGISSTGQATSSSRHL